MKFAIIVLEIRKEKLVKERAQSTDEEVQAGLTALIEKLNRAIEILQHEEVRR